jgi:ribosome modulation factor
LWVHAGQQYSKTDAAWMRHEFGLAVPNPDELQFGAILGTVELVDVTRHAFEWTPWALPGFYHWMLRVPEQLPQPIPNVEGKQGLWDYPREHHRDYDQFYAYKPDDPEFIKAWPRMVADARRLIKHARHAHGLHVGPGISGVKGHPYAETNQRRIWLNGGTPAESFDPLLIWPAGGRARDRIRNQRGWFGDVDYVWQYCHTGRLPYDTVVCAILLRCHVLAPRAFVIGSRAAWEGEWRDGASDVVHSPRALYRECFGREPRRDPLVRRHATGRPPAALKPLPEEEDDDDDRDEL